MDYCYLNGEILQYSDCKLHVSDLLFQRGYGVFDYFRCRQGSIPWLEDYTDRLYNSIRLADIKVDLNRQEFISVIDELQQKNRSCSGAFKVIVTGGNSDTLESVTGSANFVILNLPWRKQADVTFQNGVNLICCEYQRPNPEIKTLNYFNTLRLQKKIREYNAADVLYYSDFISEASRANLFFVQESSILTPASYILKGITRKQVLSLFPDITIEDIRYENLYDFDEMFLTSTSRDITPVVSVEGRKIGNGTPGKVTKEIMAAFRAKGWSND